MLVLQTNNFEYDNLLPRGYRQIDSNIPIGRSQFPSGYVYGSNIGSALLPLLFNDIPYRTTTLVKSQGIEDTLILNTLDNLYDSLDDKELLYVRVYADKTSVGVLHNLIDKDRFVSPSDTIKSLYNKCLDQTLAREGVTSENTIQIVKSRTKHMIITFTSYKDRAQESDFYLTLGLIPILFEDYKQKFNETEIEFFKVLVNRSQVKRIANVKATEAFNNLLNGEKYLKRFNKIKTEAVIIQLVNNRISEAENKVTDSIRHAEHCLNEYHTCKKRYFEAQDFLNTVRNNKDEYVNELTDALNMDNIVKVDISRGVLEIYFRTPADFYNQDEAEIIINNRTSGWLNKFFTEVFIEQKYKLNILTKFVFNYNISNDNDTFVKPSNLSYSVLNQYNAMFNPHIQYYSCLGDYLPQLIEAHAKKDLVMFNNLAIASTRSINFRDGAVMNRWLDTLSNNHMDNYNSIDLYDIKCLEDEDHNLHSIRELYMSEAPEVELHDAGEEL